MSFAVCVACGELLGATSDAPTAAADASAEGASASDAAPPDAAGHASDAATDAPPSRKRVFVTSRVYAGGDIAATFLDAGGCQAVADDAGLGGAFVAWLSLAGTSPLGRVGDGPWYTLDGGTLVAGRSDLAGEAGAPIQEDERHQSQFGGYAWTGTRADGTPDYNCSEWTDNSGVGLNGIEGTVGANGPDWTDIPVTGLARCTDGAHVYCFEK